MKKKDTSWEKVASWYEEHLGNEDTYHAKVILPNLTRILELSGNEKVLDLACGEGYFTRALKKSVSSITGADLSPSLIESAKSVSKDILYHVADATNLSFAKDKEFDVVISVLAIQNMENILAAFSECRRVLKDNGRFIFVLNHPVYRIPKASSWGYDEKEKAQYRRVDAYLTPSKVPIDMHPGSSDKTFTYSFHRSLQDYMKALRSAGFAITRLEEWISHKKSEEGPRSVAEDKARREIPLFLAVETRIL